MEFCVELSYDELMSDESLDALAGDGVLAISAPISLVDSLPKERLRERAAALKSRGIEVVTAHPRFGSYNSADSLVNQYREPRGLYLEQLKETLERMAILGAQIAPLHTGGGCLKEAPEWALALCAQSVRSLIPAAEATGVKLALENTFFAYPQRWDGSGTAAQPAQTSGHLYDDVEKLARLIELCESPMVVGCFDVGHAHYLGDLTGDHQALMPHIQLYHLHDNGRVNDTHLPPGYGSLDWEAIGPLIAANEAAYPAYIEARPWQQGSYALMIRQTRALLAGGRGGEARRCLRCGCLVLTDEQGAFCGC